MEIAFDDKMISAEDWTIHRPLLEDRRDSISKSLSEPGNDCVDAYKNTELERLNKIIELGDRGELTAIEDDQGLMDE